jgi:hypothetical protein
MAIDHALSISFWIWNASDMWISKIPYKYILSQRSKFYSNSFELAYIFRWYAKFNENFLQYWYFCDIPLRLAQLSFLSSVITALHFEIHYMAFKHLGLHVIWYMLGKHISWHTSCQTKDLLMAWKMPKPATQDIWTHIVYFNIKSSAWQTIVNIVQHSVQTLNYWLGYCISHRNNA